MVDDRTENVLEAHFPAGVAVAERALNLAFGGFLSCCHHFNQHEHHLIPKHRALVEIYDSIPDLKQAVPVLFPQEILEPISTDTEKTLDFRLTQIKNNLQQNRDTPEKDMYQSPLR